VTDEQPRKRAYTLTLRSCIMYSDSQQHLVSRASNIVNQSEFCNLIGIIMVGTVVPDTAKTTVVFLASWARGYSVSCNAVHAATFLSFSSLVARPCETANLNFWEPCVVPRPFWEQDYFIGFLTKLHAGVGLEATRCS